MVLLPRIMRHEWQTLRADKTIWLVTILFAGFIGYGVYNGVSSVRKQQATIRLLTERHEDTVTKYKTEAADYEREKASNPNAKPPDSSVYQYLGVEGYDAALPPAPLAALSTGQGNVNQLSTKVTMYNNRFDLFNEAENENPLNLLNGNFDLTFVIIYLYPLLILVLSYNLISAEREQGTLAMMLSQPVTLRRIIIGKSALRGAFILSLTIGFSVVAIVLSGVSLTSEGVVVKLLLWIVVVGLYGAFWFALAVVVGALGMNSAANATALAAAWLCFTLVIPALINLVVTSIHPVPSRVLLTQAARRAANESQEEGSRLLAQYFQDHPELMPGNAEINFKNQAQIYYAVHAEVARRVEPVMQRFDHQLAAQQRMANRYRFLSPAIITQDALDDIAGTSATRYMRFRSQVEKHQRDWQSFFIPKVFRQTSMIAADYDSYPRFRWSEEPTSEVVRRTMVGVVVLLVITAIVATLSSRFLRRYPIIG